MKTEVSYNLASGKVKNTLLRRFQLANSNSKINISQSRDFIELVKNTRHRIQQYVCSETTTLSVFIVPFSVLQIILRRKLLAATAHHLNRNDKQCSMEFKSKWFIGEGGNYAPFDYGAVESIGTIHRVLSFSFPKYSRCLAEQSFCC